MMAAHDLATRARAALAPSLRVDDEIGRGGTAIVFRALDTRLNRVVALKVLLPELALHREVRSRFLREAETSARLAHPNIVPLYDAGETDGLVFFTMALVDGETLTAHLLRDPRPPLELVREVLASTADALEHAHRHGVVHRDIKPDNVLLEARTGRVLVLDFGIARAGDEAARLTRTGVTMGSPAYMSPEQAAGDREVDGRSDVYSLGVLGYQLLAGAPPFTGPGAPMLLWQHLQERPRPLDSVRPGLPRDLVRVVERALAKDPSDRWASAGEVRDLLRARVARDAVASAEPVLRLVSASTDPGAPPPVADGRTAARELLRDARDAWHRRREPVAPKFTSEATPHPEPATSSGSERLAERARRFRARSIGCAGAAVGMVAVNAVTTPYFPWSVFPIVGIGIGLLSYGASLWASGVPALQLLRGEPATGASAGPALMSGQRADSGKRAPGKAARAPAVGDSEPERRAAADRDAIADVLATLNPTDRALLPDVESAVDALMRRIASLSVSLRQLDADVTPALREDVAARLRAAVAESPDAHDRERRVELLTRQQGTVDDLLRRRATIAAQLDSSCVMLQGIRLDLSRLRSVGASAALNDVAASTREVRAMARDVAHAADAASIIRER